MSLERVRTRGHRTAWLAEELCAQLQAARVIPTEESASDRTDQASLRKHMSDILKLNTGFAFASQKFTQNHWRQEEIGIWQQYILHRDIDTEHVPFTSRRIL